MRVNLTVEKVQRKGGDRPSVGQEVLTRGKKEVKTETISGFVPKESQNLSHKNLLGILSSLLSAPQPSSYLQICSIFDTLASCHLPEVERLLKEKLGKLSKADFNLFLQRCSMVDHPATALLIHLSLKSRGEKTNHTPIIGQWRTLTIKERDYQVMVRDCLEVAKEGQDKLEKFIDQYDIVILGDLSSKPTFDDMDIVCRNLIELLEALLVMDLTNCLKYLTLKVSKEIIKSPFELHLAKGLHKELSTQSSDELLSFVENISQFIRVHRLLTLFRHCNLEQSKLDPISSFKMSNKFGDAEDLSFLTFQTQAPSCQRLAENSSFLLQTSGTIEVATKSVNHELLPFNFASLPALPPWLPISQVEAKFKETQGKLLTILPIVESFDEGFLTIQPHFFTILQSKEEPTEPITSSYLKFLRQKGIVERASPPQLVKNFDNILAKLAVNSMVDLSYDCSRTDAYLDILNTNIVQKDGKRDDTLALSRIMRLVKGSKNLTLEDLQNQMKAKYSLGGSPEDYTRWLDRLKELQYISVEGSLITYLT